MALSLPCIATPVGAMPEIMAHTTRLIPTADPAALARHAAELVADHPLRLREGEANRQAVLARYTESRVADTLRSLYSNPNSTS